MKNNYFDYLKSLSKDELIFLIYKPYRKFKKINSITYRNIALKISYDGTAYSGLAEFKYGNTVGNHIRNALLMSTLGEKITYAGRTDSGVSAVGMIASLYVKSRCSFSSNRYNLIPEDSMEFNYEKILNSYLPNDIRILGWAPVEEEFNARFTCIQRKYRYYFCKDGYDLGKMQEMCETIKNMKNFYNFSKHSDESARYERTIDVCQILEDGNLMYLDIRARSFLHNMVRKIFWVLDKTGKSEVFDFESVGISDPNNLIFYEAVYPMKLSFYTLPRHEGNLKTEFSNCLVKYKIKEEILKSRMK
jgi:tRNA pseudouridine38/39 synthase